MVRHRSDVNPQRLVLFGQVLAGRIFWMLLVRVIVKAYGGDPRLHIRLLCDHRQPDAPGSGYLLDESYSGENYIASVSRSRFY